MNISTNLNLERLFSYYINNSEHIVTSDMRKRHFLRQVTPEYCFSKFIEGDPVLTSLFNQDGSLRIEALLTMSNERLIALLKYLKHCNMFWKQSVADATYCVTLDISFSNLYEIDWSTLLHILVEKDELYHINYNTVEFVVRPSDPVYYIATQYMLGIERKLTFNTIQDLACMYVDIFGEEHPDIVTEYTYISIDKEEFRNTIMQIRGGNE